MWLKPIVIFRPKYKSIIKHMNFRIGDQRVHLSSTVRYLGVILHENPVWEQHLNTLTEKLNRELGLLAKIWHHFLKSLLKTIHFSLFNSQLVHASQIWGQHEVLISAIQDKAIRNINFKTKNYFTGNFYQSNKVLKLGHNIRWINSMYVKKCSKRHPSKNISKHTWEKAN